MTYEVRTIDAAASRPVRAEVLRPGQPPETLVYDGDDTGDTFHAGAFDGDDLVSVGRLSREPLPGSDDPNAWRLRGMATLEPHRGRGAGAAVLARLLREAAARGATEVWCNARIGARSFYERAGFEVEGDEFHLPGIGPHLRLRLRPVRA